MHTPLLLSWVAAVALGVGTQTPDTTLERMPAALETSFALSALPLPMRARASLYLLDPAKGYVLTQTGTSGITCLVARTEWERADYRNDVYVPMCYDAEGTRTYLKVIIDAAALRASGKSPAALRAEIAQRYHDDTSAVPKKAGLAYMVSPVMRTWDDKGVRTMFGPHVMFYAPNVTNADLGAEPHVPGFPFALPGGVATETYIIQSLGKAEAARVLTDEKPLLRALCSYRATLCLHTQR